MFQNVLNSFYTDLWFVDPAWHRNAGIALNAYLEKGSGIALPGETFSAADSRQSPSSPGVEIIDGYALLRMQGVVGRHLSSMEMQCGGGYDTMLLERQFLELESRRDVHTILLSIHSPGGHASGCAELARIIAQVGKIKNTIAWVDNMAASAAYYFACACNEVYGSETSNGGAIGCYAALLDVSRQWEEEGKVLHLFRSAPGKGRGAAGSIITDEDKAFYQSRVAELGGKFVDFVTERRLVRLAMDGKTPLLNDEALNGDYFTGEACVANGLYDGTFDSLSHLFSHLLTRSAA